MTFGVLVVAQRRWAVPTRRKIVPGREAVPHRESRTDHLRRTPMKAMWNGAVLAESDRTVVVEGNHYFPPDAIRTEYFRPSDTHTVCGWKGTASYYTVEVDGKQNPDAAWYYPEPKDAARQIAGFVAFWKGVTVTP
jgi:uncharacterized protein (DUF427 family)